MKEFEKYHPIVNFIYFFAVIGFSMILMHPLFLAISFFCAFCYSCILGGEKNLKFNLFYLLPIFLAAALMNPAFNHEGVTILAYLPSGNPLTLESIVYGFASAAGFVTVISWFSCVNIVMTSDKLVYLFGKITPSFSLIFSMVLRFVPKFRSRIKVVSNAQKGIGLGVSDGNCLKRVKNGVKILSIVITWALEDAICTADSMKSRGYGLPGRTAFSNYEFSKRDKNALVLIIFFASCVLSGIIFGVTEFKYFPYLWGNEISIGGICIAFAYFMLCILPVIIEARGMYKWKLSKSKI